MRIFIVAGEIEPPMATSNRDQVGVTVFTFCDKRRVAGLLAGVEETLICGGYSRQATIANIEHLKFSCILRATFEQFNKEVINAEHYVHKSDQFIAALRQRSCLPVRLVDRQVNYQAQLALFFLRKPIAARGYRFAYVSGSLARDTRGFPRADVQSKNCLITKHRLKVVNDIVFIALLARFNRKSRIAIRINASVSANFALEGCLLRCSYTPEELHRLNTRKSIRQIE